MTIIDADQSAVLAAIERFYKSRLNLADDCIFPTTNPRAAPSVAPGGDFFVGIHCGDGTFPFEEQMEEQLFESFDVVVMGYSRMQYDPLDYDRALYYKPDVSAFAIKRRLLLLAGHHLIDADGNELLRSLPYAKGSIKPDYDPEKGISWVGVVFGIEFDWIIPEADDD